MTDKGKPGNTPTVDARFRPYAEEHYRELKRRHVIRLIITYLAPLALLAVYFQYQYSELSSEGRRLHLSAIAENQANTLDLFLSERLMNLGNLIDHPRFHTPPSSEQLSDYLNDLKMTSVAFVDIGFFDSAGVQVSYAGPFPDLEQKNYRSEVWYATLKGGENAFVISDIYLGFRQRPHFTIAVSRTFGGHFMVLRATLDPGRIYEYITRRQKTGDVTSSIINRQGAYQLVSEAVGSPLEACPLPVPDDSLDGTAVAELEGRTATYAYRWLQNAEWAIIVQSTEAGIAIFHGYPLRVLLISAGLLGLILIVIFNRASSLVRQQIESDQTRAQLEHASKLASVGELAAGIAHEINNPLAVISEEAGLIMDYMNPELADGISEDDLLERLTTIQQSAFRCRDITRKLLNFVRKTDLDLKAHDIHSIIDGVIDGLLGPELAVSNIEITRDYDRALPQIVTDKNQLQQVILNMVNNAGDAIGGNKGRISVSTSRREKMLTVSINDTGHGMTPDQLEKIFLPFYTTKEVGKGTGLGLSVSFGIVRSLGGEIKVTSAPGEGSTFTILLPLKKKA